MFHYQISVSLNGKFFFRTDDSETDELRAALTAKTIKTAMPECEVTLSKMDRTIYTVPVPLWMGI